MSTFSPVDRTASANAVRVWEKISESAHARAATHTNKKSKIINYIYTPDGNGSDEYTERLLDLDFKLESPALLKGISAYLDQNNKKVFFSSLEIILGLPDSSALTIATICIDYKLTCRWFDGLSNFGLFTSKEPIDSLIIKMKNDLRIIYAEPNVLNGISTVLTSDIESEGVELPAGRIWNHDAVDRYSNWRDSNGAGVIVAVVDTPIELDHQCLQSVLYPPTAEFHFGDSVFKPMSHGTSVASIIAGVSKYGESIPLGLAPGARILPISIDTSSDSSYAKRSTAISFLAKAYRDKKIYSKLYGELPLPRLIVNCSWQLQNSQDLTCARIAFEALESSGAICVCSAGNDDSDAPHFPSDYSGCLSVAALTRDLNKSPNSNYGSQVDFSLPGGDGTPFDEDDILAAQKGNIFDFTSGTSFAAPHCSAILACIWSNNPNLAGAEVVEKARSSHVKTIPDRKEQYSGKLGNGILTLKNQRGI